MSPYSTRAALERGAREEEHAQTALQLAQQRMQQAQQRAAVLEREFNERKEEYSRKEMAVKALRVRVSCHRKGKVLFGSSQRWLDLEWILVGS